MWYGGKAPWGPRFGYSEHLSGWAGDPDDGGHGSDTYTALKPHGAAQQGGCQVFTNHIHRISSRDLPLGDRWLCIQMALEQIAAEREGTRGRGEGYREITRG